MEKEEKIVVILLSMILLSLSISYLVFFEDSDSDASAFSSSSVPGDCVFVEGSVLSERFTYSGNHLIVVLDAASGPVKVFVPADNGASEVGSLLQEDLHVRVFGIVDEYEGETEIVVQAADDVLVS